MKNRATIRMQANKFTVDVNDGKGGVVNFDLNSLDKHALHKFIVMFVRAFRDAQVAA